MNDLDTANVHLLLVEDNERYLERAIRRLKEFGYAHIDSALDEDEAREKLAHKHFDVIIADMRLGSHEDGGFTIVDEVKQRQITSVIIILTANDTVQDCRKALKGYACWDYISKSIQQGSDKSPLEELHKSIQKALVYLNYWGNPKDEKWIADNAEFLQEHYINQYVAVIDNMVLASADSEEALKQKLDERKLPFFLPVIKKIETEAPPSIAELIKKGESATLEFKQTFQYDGSHKKNEKLRLATLKTLVAFLNSKGGTLLIGVEDKGSIYGLENDFSFFLNKQKTPIDLFEQELTNLICDRIGKEFAQHITLCFEKIEGKQICAIIVKKAKQKAYYKKDKTVVYIRANCTTRTIETLEEWFDYIAEEKALD